MKRVFATNLQPSFNNVSGGEWENNARFSVEQQQLQYLENLIMIEGN
jgi:hypothetical protein